MPPVSFLPQAIVLDCAFGRTSLGVFSRTGNRVRLDRFAVESPAAGPATTEEWLQQTRAAFRTLRGKNPAKGTAILILPGHLTLTKAVQVPRVGPEQSGKIIRFEAEQNFPYALADVSWANCLAGETETGREVLLIAARLDLVEPLCAAAQEAGFEPGCVLPDWSALWAGFRLAQPACPDCALVLALGARSATLLKVEPGGLAVRTFSTAGVDVALEVVRSVQHFRARGKPGEPRRLLVNAAVGREPDLCADLSTRLALPIEAIEIRPAIGYAGDAVRPASVAETDSLPLLAGGAVAWLRSEVPEVNLLPPARRERLSRDRRRLWRLTATALLLAALVPPGIAYQRLTGETVKKTKALERRLAPLRSIEARCRNNLARLAGLRREITGLESLSTRRRSWLVLLAGLQDRLTQAEDVWLEKLQVLPGAAGSTLKLAVTGCLLDKTNPTGPATPTALTRAKALLAGLATTPLVVAVEEERFDGSQPGILRFDCVLVTGTQPLL